MYADYLNWKRRLLPFIVIDCDCRQLERRPCSASRHTDQISISSSKCRLQRTTGIENETRTRKMGKRKISGAQGKRNEREKHIFYLSLKASFPIFRAITFCSKRSETRTSPVKRFNKRKNNAVVTTRQMSIGAHQRTLATWPKWQ